MTDVERPRMTPRRIAARVLRPFRLTAGRFIQPTIEARAGALDARAAALGERVETLERGAAEAREQAAVLGSRVQVVEDAAAGTRGQAAALGERVDTLERGAAEAREQAAVLGSRVQVVEDAAAGTRGQAAALGERVDTLERGAAEAREQAAVLGSRIEAQRSETMTHLGRMIETQDVHSFESRQRLRSELMTEVERTRSRMAVPDSDVVALEEYRSSAEYRRIYEEAEPKVSVTIATFDRADLLVERCLTSVIGQDYQNLEVIVVGDGCTDDTRERVLAIDDERIRYVDLVDRVVPAAIGRGADALNLARSLATGDLLTHLDDDDEYTPDRIGRLVRFLQATRAEFVWHPFWWQESADAEWAINDADAFAFAKVTSGAVLYLGWFSRVAWDPMARRYRIPGDWALLHTLRDLRVRARRYPVPLLRHYLERQNPRLEEGRRSTDRLARPTLSALQRQMPLVPEISSPAGYDALVGQVRPWLRATLEICERVGIPTSGGTRAVADATRPTLITDGGHVLRLYGPWRAGEAAYRQELAGLELGGRVAGRQLPRLLAHGTLDGAWSYMVTTEIPGVALSTLRDELSSASLERTGRWLADMVRDLHAIPLGAEERATGWKAARASIAKRRRSIGRSPTRWDALPAGLRSGLKTWMPSLDELVADPEQVVVVHGALDDPHVLGVWHTGQFDPTGVIGLRHVRIGPPLLELPAVGAVFRWDPALLRTFLLEMGWPGVRGLDFPRLALAHLLLGGADRLRGLSVLHEVRDLDDLAARLFDPGVLASASGAAQ